VLRPGPTRYRYGDHRSQYAELSLPIGNRPVPVVVVVHGGFWRTAYGAELGRPLAADLAARGWAALNVEYRRVGRSRSAGGGGWPRTLEDVAAAVDSLAGSGQRLADDRLDLTRVVGLGHSAGGHLAGWAAARGRLPRDAPGADPVVPLIGLVSQAGVLELVAAAREGLGGGAVLDLMGGGPDDRAGDYALASPGARLPLGVPSVCVHGSADATVPIRQSEAFVSAARASGDDSELRAFDGDHFAPITVGAAAWSLCTEALARLLGR
jgi:acetyl esterase/lipase